MPLTINYKDDGRGIEILATGTVHGREIIDAHKEIYSEENLKRQLYQIIDRSLCLEYDVSTEEIKKIAELDNTAALINPHIIIAIVAPDDLQYGMSRIWQAYTDESGFKTRVFRDRKSADLWLAELLKRT